MKSSRSILPLLLILLTCSNAYPYSEEAHEALNEHIADNSIAGFSLDNYAYQILGFKNGIDEIFESSGEAYSILQWLGEGGIKEDKPSSDLSQYLAYYSNSARNNNHFHDPTKRWGEAGLDAWLYDPLLRIPRQFTGKSLAVWAQDTNGQRRVLENRSVLRGAGFNEKEDLIAV